MSASIEELKNLLEASDIQPNYPTNGWYVDFWLKLISKRISQTNHLILEKVLRSADKIEEFFTTYITHALTKEKDLILSKEEQQQLRNFKKYFYDNLNEVLKAALWKIFKQNKTSSQKLSIEQLMPFVMHITPDDIARLYVVFHYENPNENFEAAQLCADYLPLAPLNPDPNQGPFEYEESAVFNRYISLTPQDDFDQIPEVTLEGASINPICSNFYLERLSANNPLSLVIGEIIDNCELLSSKPDPDPRVYIGGRGAALLSVTSPYFGKYVIRKKKTKKGEYDPITAYTSAWRSNDGAIIFDAIQFLHDSTHHFIRKNHENFVVDLFFHLAHQLVSQENNSKLSVPYVALGRYNFMLSQVDLYFNFKDFVWIGALLKQSHLKNPYPTESGESAFQFCIALKGFPLCYYPLVNWENIESSFWLNEIKKFAKQTNNRTEKLHEIPYFMDWLGSCIFLKRELYLQNFHSLLDAGRKKEFDRLIDVSKKINDNILKYSSDIKALLQFCVENIINSPFVAYPNSSAGTFGNPDGLYRDYFELTLSRDLVVYCIENDDLSSLRLVLTLEDPSGTLVPSSLPRALHAAFSNANYAAAAYLITTYSTNETLVTAAHVLVQASKEHITPFLDHLSERNVMQEIIARLLKSILFRLFNPPYQASAILLENDLIMSLLKRATKLQIDLKCEEDAFANNLLHYAMYACGQKQISYEPVMYLLQQGFDLEKRNCSQQNGQSFFPLFSLMKPSAQIAQETLDPSLNVAGPPSN
jgi:hypothetical protein